MFTCKLWLTGSVEPVEFTLDTDELLAKFTRWLQDDVQLKTKGYVVKDAERRRVINFSNVAMLEVSPVRKGASTGEPAMLADEPRQA
jgi:hypothetical protein